MQQIYLDYNATTPIAPEVRDAIWPFLDSHFGNPSSSHALGVICREAIEEARGRIATLIGAEPEEIFFTSGGTESNNLVLNGLLTSTERQRSELVTSCFEHPAVKNPAKFHESQGGKVTYLQTDQSGLVDLDQLADSVNPQTKLVSIMHANNEIGTIQPIAEIGEVCKRHGALLHTDAAQSVGKIRCKVDELGVDFLTIAGHKLYAPKGIGALYIRNGISLQPHIHGANHERGVRPGTENVPFIVGLGVAARLATEKESRTAPELSALRDQLETALLSGIGASDCINGSGGSRLPNTSSISFPRVNAAEMLKRIPELCVSTGAACHSDSISLSDTLQAIGLSDSQGAGTVRISCGRFTTQAEIETAISLLLQAWEDCCESK